MATTTRTLSTKVNKSGQSEIMLRVNVNHVKRIRIKSGLFISPNRFKDGNIIKPRANQIELAELNQLESALVQLEMLIEDIRKSYAHRGEELTKEALVEEIDRVRHPEQYEDETDNIEGFFDTFQRFIDNHTNLSVIRTRQYHVLKRTLARFEAYKRISCRANKDYTLSVDSFSLETVKDFEKFLRNEATIYDKYPKLYEDLPTVAKNCQRLVKPTERGNNTIISIFSRLRTFFNWCNAEGITPNKPFQGYCGVTQEVYGTPYYITPEERDIIAKYDLSATPSLAKQRDIFVFQCLIGCRVSDLMKMTHSNIINGAVEYFASKTKDERPEVIRVPLHPTAIALIERYKGKVADNRLFPFITPQKYNEAIKEIFTKCGITRLVTVLNPTTSQEEQRPINEIASSHLARRTFIGNLYKKVQDPNLIGSMSGHVQGSKAFVRYRAIDDETKRDVINLL